MPNILYDAIVELMHIIVEYVRNYFDPKELGGPIVWVLKRFEIKTMVFGVIPVKYFLAFLHILALLIVTSLVFWIPKAFPLILPLSLYFVIVIVAFHFEYIPIMVVNFRITRSWFPSFFAVFPLILVCVFGMLDVLFNGLNKYEAMLDALKRYGIGPMLFFVLCVFFCLFLILTFFVYYYYLKNSYFYIMSIEKSKNQEMLVQCKCDKPIINENYVEQV